MTPKCKICGNKNLSPFLSFDKYPRSISYLHNKKDEALKDYYRIFFLVCDFCNLVQIGEDMPQQFYEDYIMTVSHSKKMNNFQREQATLFVSNYNLYGKNIFEIGCGDGNFSMILNSLGCKVFCNEPSQSFRKIAEQKGLSVDHRFINYGYKNLDAPFDAIVSREVMEHIPEPMEFLHVINSLLKPNGSVLIEVPNFEKTIRENRYYDMFPDHLSYFTADTLTAAMLLSGFSEVKINYGMEQEFIYAMATKKSINPTELLQSFKSITYEINEILETYDNVVFWGAGGKGISTLGSLLDTKRIKYVVDSDLYKQGKYLPSSGIIVKSPNEFINDVSVDLLIITNLAYTDEILEILKLNGFNKPIKILSKLGLENIQI